MHDKLIEIYNAAIAAVDPYRVVLGKVGVAGGRLHVADAEYDLGGYGRILVVGAGKATARMALALEELLGERISAGLVIVKDGHTEALSSIEQVEAAHPVPDARGLDATARMLQMVQAADAHTLVICLLSGGASALMVKPANAMTLQDLQQTTELLLSSGATIGELNAVRKHLSSIKGGGLSKAAYPADVLTLVLSDVIGDRLDVIASGPTVADSTTFAEAMHVIEKYGLKPRMPLSVVQYLSRGVAGEVPETAKAGDASLLKTRNIVIGSLRQALVAAEVAARQLGFDTELLTAELHGEARNAARLLAQAAKQARCTLHGRRCCFLSGGETTVSVRGHGKGGRNQELALAFALEVEGMEDVFLLAAGTDGSDGPTDAAGAMVHGKTATHARRLGIEPVHYLENCDSYNFFKNLDALSGSGSHFITGPTGTNVMDIQIILVGGRGKERPVK